MTGLTKKGSPPHQEEPGSPPPFQFAILFLIVALTIGLSAYLYYATQQQQLVQKMKEELGAIADLKAGQLESWRQERLGDAEVTTRTGFIAGLVRQYSAHPERLDLKQDILSWMQSFHDVFHYSTIILVDQEGTVLLGIGEDSNTIGAHAKKLARDAIRMQRPLLSDFHAVAEAPMPHLDLAAPLLVRTGGTGHAAGTLLYRVDPALFLYPLLQSWPAPGRTGETLLLRLEDKEIVYLNRLRHSTDQPLTLRAPLTREMQQILQASPDRASAFEAFDYRNVPVLAAARAVADTPWYLVAKIDLQEVYAPIHERARFLAVVTAILIIAAGFSVLLWWRKKSAEYDRQRLKIESERHALVLKYDYLSKYANDIILLLDPDGSIREANDRAVSSYGYSRQELLRMTIREIRAPGMPDPEDRPTKDGKEHRGLVFETMHVRKDGSFFPVEISSRVIEIDGKNYHQDIIRDITERKQSEQQVQESRKLLQAIIETEPECIKLLDRAGNVIMMNRAGLEMLQADSFKAIEGKPAVSLVKPEHREAFLMGIEQVFQGESVQIEFEITGIRGRELWLETHAVPLRNEKNQISSLLGVTRDITERKKTESVMRRITRLYAVLGQINQAIVRSSDRQELFESICRTIVWYGQFKTAWIGLKDQQALTLRPAAYSGLAGDSSQDFSLPLGDDTAVHSPTARAISSGQHVICNDIENDPDLASFHRLAAGRGYGSSASFPLRLHGAVIGALSIYSSDRAFFNHDEIELLDDVAGNISFALENLDREIRRKQAETDLINERNRSAGIVAAIGDGISIQDRDFKVLYQNERHREMAGGSFIGQYCYQAYENRDSVCDHCPVGRSFEDGQVHTAERSATRNGKVRYVEIASSPLRDPEGRIVAGIEAVREITGRKRMEQALGESEKRYKLLVESITDYIYTVKVENGRPVQTVHGPGCLSVTGYSAAEFSADPSLWYRIIQGEDRAAVVEQANRILTGQPVAPIEHRIIHKNGTIRWIKNSPVPRFDAAGGLIDYDGLISNITALKQLEAQLRQAQKMEAVGQLAGGIAHDFNNILTAIIGYGNLLLMKMPEPAPLRPYVQQVLASAERAAGLTQSLLAFSRKQIIDLKALDVNAVIARVERFLERLIGEDIELTSSLHEGELTVLADSVQIEQVLMNLVTNARDAMPNGGKLSIETDIYEMGAEFLRTHAYGKTGTYARIMVSDTGTGMDEKTRNKIFEPFFTTKEVGKGTGLGLAMVYGIVKQHGGYINVYSEPAQGTTFKIYLPLTAVPGRRTVPDIPPGSHQGSETVLLAEDDEEVRALTKTVLQDFGYGVIEAADGEEAVRKFMENREKIDLLVLDIIMPRKNGREAYLEIKADQPGIKALFTSGYTADVIHKKGILETGLDFVLKPISPTDFLKKVREVLDKA